MPGFLYFLLGYFSTKLSDCKYRSWHITDAENTPDFTQGKARSQAHRPPGTGSDPEGTHRTPVIPNLEGKQKDLWKLQ